MGLFEFTLFEHNTDVQNVHLKEQQEMQTSLLSKAYSVPLQLEAAEVLALGIPKAGTLGTIAVLLNPFE
jgi:hypothetical protein